MTRLTCWDHHTDWTKEEALNTCLAAKYPRLAHPCSNCPEYHGICPNCLRQTQWCHPVERCTPCSCHHYCTTSHLRTQVCLHLGDKSPDQFGGGQSAVHRPEEHLSSHLHCKAYARGKIRPCYPRSKTLSNIPGDRISNFC